jgi:integrase/recombinase XerD
MGKGFPGSSAIAGPLAVYEDELRTALTVVGYRPRSVEEALRAMRRLDGCLRVAGLQPGALTPQVLAGLAVSPRGLAPVLGFLRRRGVLPEPDVVPGDAQAEVVLARFRAYLVGERGLAAASVRCYLTQTRAFLQELPRPLESALAGLEARTVTSFVVRHSAGAKSSWSAKTLVTGLRAFLRFAYVEGLIPAELAGSVPGVAGWRLAGLPRAVDKAEIQGLLAGCDTSTTVGLRDRAVLLLLARMGLRGAEAAALTLADVDWRAGQITVRGKGSRAEQLPLPAEVGASLEAYVMGGRPRADCPAVFVTTRAPHRTLSPGAVRALVGRACQRAGLVRFGGHRLRHALASDLLRAGAPLAEVGQVLRHRSQLSTAVYAKVDFEALRTVTAPWPGEAA